MSDDGAPLPPLPRPDAPARDLPDPEALAPAIYERCLAAVEGFEFTTYVLGVQARRLAKRTPEAALDAWKLALKRAVGLRLATAWEPLGRRVSFDGAELVLRWDQDVGAVDDVRTRSAFVFGRYAKLVRDLPQTRATWPCPTCKANTPPAGDGAAGGSSAGASPGSPPASPRGPTTGPGARRPRGKLRGCDACLGTGKKFPSSIEDLIAGPLATALGVEPASGRLHGMGREDTDVRCLEGGRPFVVEVQRPRRRATDLAAAARAIEAGAAGRVALVGPLVPCGERVVARVKAWDAPKAYRAVVLAEGPLDPARVAGLVALRGVELAQRTPARVARRRADLVRPRRVLDLQVLGHEGARVELRVETQSGTYIKELISGDDGRTTPSIAGLLGLPARCIELDVVAVLATSEELLGDGPVRSRDGGDGDDDS